MSFGFTPTPVVWLLVCGPLEGVFDAVYSFFFGRTPIPPILQEEGGLAAPPDSDDDSSSDEEDINPKKLNTLNKKDKAKLLKRIERQKKVKEKRKETRKEKWGHLSRAEQAIIVARRRKTGSLSFDIKYERLPSDARPLKGVHFNDW